MSSLAGVYMRGYRWADMPNPLSPFWIQYAVYRVIGDSLTYWLVLGAGFALLAFDEDQVRRRQNAELERSLVAAQVDALKMKLQPHFLFNTLNSISFLGLERDTGALVTMIQRLGALLRSSMQSGGSQLVALGEELALLDQYLSIEEVRFADRLSVGRSIDPAARDALVPSLVLQPIVENSIKHGFSRRIDARRIDIAVTRDADTIVFTVEDDGPGMPDGWSLATHCGRGLKNVIDRIDRLYPGAWSFSLGNRSGGGAIATLRLPWRAAAPAARPAAPEWQAHP
jgi:LytS/YehU family sensor histidine kinase